MADITPRISPINAPKKTERQLIEEADMETPEVAAPTVSAPVAAPVAPVSAPAVSAAPSIPEIKPVAAQPATVDKYQHPTNPYADVAKPGVPDSYVAGSMNLFKDEQAAYQKMLDAGYDDAGAKQLIKQRRTDLMGGNTQLKQSEAVALLKMREAGLDAKTAIKLLNDKRQADEASSPAWKKAGEGALNLAAGNLQTIAQYGGNVLDFLTGGKLGVGEEVKQMLEQNKKDFGDSAAFTAGTYAPDVAMAVAPGGALLKGGKAAVQGAQAVSKAAKIATTLGKSSAVGGAYGAVTPILNKGSEATAGDIGTSAALGTAAGVVLPIVGKGVQKVAGKAWDYVSKALPERLQISGQLSRADLTNVSERLAKLTGKEAEPADAARWLLDREVKGSLEAQRAQVQGLTEKAHQQASALLESKAGDVGNTKAADNLRKALSEKLDEYGSFDKNGNFVASAGNEAKAAAIQKAITSPTMTLKEMNDARRILAERLFTKMGSPKELSKLEGWQKVWKETSQFIEDKAPGFRKANKDVEVGMAINQAMLKKESAQQAQQMLAYLGVSGLGAGAGYYQGGDIGSAAKGAAIVFGVGQLSKFLNSPAVKSRLAYALNKLSPAARQSIEQLKKGVEIEPEAIKLVNTELKALNLADLASEGKVGAPIIKPIGKKSPVQPFTKGSPVSNPSVAGSKAPQFGEVGFIQ